MKIFEKRQKRAELWEGAKALMAKAEAEKRAMSAEEESNFDARMAEVDKLKKEIDRDERAAAIDAELAAPAALPESYARSENIDDEEISARFGRGVTRARVTRAQPLTKEQRARQKQVREFLRSGPSGEMEFRSLQADSETGGGATFQREEFVATLIKFVDDQTWIRPLATVLPVVNSDSIGVPTLENDPADADWTSELATGAEDSTMSFGKRAMTVHPLAKRIKISDKLLRISALNPEQLVAQRLAYKFGITQEKAFLTGSGVQQPLGIFTASAAGIPTTRDITTTAAADIKADDLITLLYKLKAQYQAKCSWLMHRDTVARVRKLKDNNNQYLWAPGMTGFASIAGPQPDTILGRPLMMSEYAPNTFTTGLYIAMLADFSWYWIAESLQMRLQKLIELYAETNQVGFIARMEIDGAPVLAEAFSRLKLQ